MSSGVAARAEDRTVALPPAPRPPIRPEDAYLKGLKASGRRTQEARLKLVARILGAEDYREVPWERMRAAHVLAIRSELEGYVPNPKKPGETLAPASINAALAALRGVAKAAWRLELLSSDDLERIRDVEDVKGERLPKGRSAKPGELDLLLGACVRDPSPAGLRDAAIIGVLYATGMRRDELAGLELRHYEPPEEYGRDAGALTVLGKGNKQRICYLDEGSSRMLDDWLRLRSRWPGPIFVPINKAGRLGNTPLSAERVYSMLAERASGAGIADLTPHDFRRTFVGDMLDKGIDITTVSDMVGHASLETTRRYDRRGERRKAEAAGQRHVPYRRWRGPTPPTT